MGRSCGATGWRGNPNWVFDYGKDYPRLIWEGTPGSPSPDASGEGRAQSRWRWHARKVNGCGAGAGCGRRRGFRPKRNRRMFSRRMSSSYRAIGDGEGAEDDDQVLQPQGDGELDHVEADGEDHRLVQDVEGQDRVVGVFQEAVAEPQVPAGEAADRDQDAQQRTPRIRANPTLSSGRPFILTRK